MDSIETQRGREITVPGWLRNDQSLFVDYDGEGAPGYQPVAVLLVYYPLRENERRGEIDIYVDEILFHHVGVWEVNSGIILGMEEKYGIDRNGRQMGGEDGH